LKDSRTRDSKDQSNDSHIAEERGFGANEQAASSSEGECDSQKRPPLSGFRMTPVKADELASHDVASRGLPFRYLLRFVAGVGAVAIVFALANLGAKSPAHMPSALRYVLGIDSRVLTRPHRVTLIAVPAEPPEYFLPWRRSDVAQIIRRWRAAGPVEVSPYEMPTTNRYAMWKERANLVIAGIASRGAARRAGILASWLHRYEAHEAWAAAGRVGIEPPAAGGEPQAFSDGVGPLPPAAFRGLSLQYTCRLPGVSRTFVFHDHPVDPDYPFLLNANGVADEGVRLGDRKDCGAVFGQANIDPEAASILRTVSVREGGFEAVNTYDTGYVSVGFIQFTAMQSGRGSLISVMMRMKVEAPLEYAHYFSAFGVDIDDSGQLVVVDPGSGAVLRGERAVDRVIADKRLTSVFYHAGAGSRGFQVAQIRQARSQYFAPAHRFDIPEASVTDYTNPDRPVKNYYYGVDAIAKAQQFVLAMNAKAWMPPREPSSSAVDKQQGRLAPLDIGADVCGGGKPSMKFHRRIPLSPGQARAADGAPKSEDGGKTFLFTLSDAQPRAQEVGSPSTAEPDLTPRYDDADAQKTVRSPAMAKGKSETAPANDLPSDAAIKPLPDVGKPPTLAMPFGGAGILTRQYNYHGPRYVFAREADLVGTYGQVFKSGAGQAAIVDRCVQHGFEYGPTREGLAAKFEQAVDQVAKCKPVTVHDLALAERDLIPGVQNRIDVLHIARLSQPGANGIPVPSADSSAERPAVGHRHKRHALPV
jgi:hypothetical protein